MSNLIKYSGLLIILIGVVLLVFSFVKGVTGNTGLITSLLLVVTGFVVYLLTNRYYD